MTPRLFNYLCYGLTVASEVAIPGAMAVRARGGVEAVDIDITLGSAPLQGEVREIGPYRWVGDCFDFTMPGLARYVCFEGARIVIDIADGADQSDVAAMLIATMLPAVLWSRGEIVLHAATVSFCDSGLAIAIAGASGSGKSTCLRRSIELGAWAIADDSTRIRVGSDGMSASGLPAGYFERTAQDEHRDFQGIPSHRQLTEQRLGALLILTPGITVTRRLEGLAALTAILKHRHRPQIARLMGREPALLPAIARLAESIPVIEMPTHI